MGMCYIDKDNGTQGLTDEQINEHKRNTQYHQEITLDGQIRESNCSTAQDNINNQRRK